MPLPLACLLAAASANRVSCRLFFLPPCAYFVGPLILLPLASSLAAASASCTLLRFFVTPCEYFAGPLSFLRLASSLAAAPVGLFSLSVFSSSFFLFLPPFAGAKMKTKIYGHTHTSCKTLWKEQLVQIILHPYSPRLPCEQHASKAQEVHHQVDEEVQEVHQQEAQQVHHQEVHPE